jgi:organic radical activating enzyme
MTDPEPAPNVIEYFYSIQGEGLKIGIPSYFIRFAGCNINCPWCDTKYSWDKSSAIAKTLDLESDLRQNYPKCREVVFTGGEPLLYQYDIFMFMKKLDVTELADPYNFTIETNGSIAPAPGLAFRKNILWSVSPKLFLPNWRDQVEVFDMLKHVQFKFVISSPEVELDQIAEFNINHPVIVQPNCEEYAFSQYSYDLHKLSEAVIDKGLKFRVLPQLHKVCWGNRRNV